MKQWRLKKDIIHPALMLKAGVIGEEALEEGLIFFKDEDGVKKYWPESDLAVLTDWFELVDPEEESQELTKETMELKPSQQIFRKMDERVARGVSPDTAGILSILDFLDEHFKN